MDSEWTDPKRTAWTVREGESQGPCGQRMDRVDGWKRWTNGFRGLRTRLRIHAMGARLSLCEAEAAASAEENPVPEAEEEVRIRGNQRDRKTEGAEGEWNCKREGRAPSDQQEDVDDACISAPGHSHGLRTRPSKTQEKEKLERSREKEPRTRWTRESGYPAVRRDRVRWQLREVERNRKRGSGGRDDCKNARRVNLTAFLSHVGRGTGTSGRARRGIGRGGQGDQGK